ncbi:MAG TPA: glutathione S-transferase family protein [Chthoniobacterales bacterium]|nr:glutathione S-transferase family protein [Chthoniobacterales bacterium]
MPAQFPNEQTDTGEFQRQEDAFREWISNDGSTSYPAAAGRYHLYVSLACPWASRTVIFRKLKGLENAIGLTIVDPFRDEKGWAFRDPERSRPGSQLNKLDEFESTDDVNGFHYLSQAYAATDPGFDGRVTVPVLWDKETKKIVNNCEDDICPMFNRVFNEFAKNKDVDLFPKDIEAEHTKLSEFIYDNINNGVYKAGFTTRQRAYEISCRKLFDALDEMEKRLSKSRYLFGKRIVEADWRLFCTLIRFDVVYHGHFKCNLRRIIDYPNLQGYLLDLYQQPGIAETVSIDHIKRHYYMTHEEINPTRIVPLGPIVDLAQPHGRERI